MCGGNACNLLSDLVDDYCMLFGPGNNYAIENLGGFNKVTNSCPIQFSGNGFDSYVVNNGSNRQIVFHKNAKVRSTSPWSSLLDMPYQEGIFLSFSGDDFPSNKFYTLKFDLHQIIPYGCTVSSPFTFVPFAPTIYFHTLVNISDGIRLRHGHLEDNVYALGTENLK